MKQKKNGFRKGKKRNMKRVLCLTAAVLFAIGGNIRAAFAVNAGVCALIATAVFLVHCRHRSAEKQKPDYRASGAFAGFALGAAAAIIIVISSAASSGTGIITGI